MLLPRNIVDDISTKTPDTKGEEGRLYRISQGNQNFYAKEWYFNQDKAAIANSPDDIHFSPYWAKLKFYEYQLIHRAFPDYTISMPMGFDPRIQKKRGSYEFNFPSDFPVTVTREVATSTLLKEQREAILSCAYEVMHDYARTTNKGVNATQDQRERFYQTIERADSEMQELSGEELHLPRLLNPFVPHESLDDYLQYARTVNAQSSVTRLLESGILPIHPEFNFIPQGRSDVHPAGTFIELMILDINKYVQRTLESQKIPKNTLIALTVRFSLFQALDSMFDSLVRQSDEAIIFNQDVHNSLFRIFELLRRMAEKFGVSVLHKKYAEITSFILEILKLGELEDILFNLQRLEQFYKEQVF